MLHLGDASDAKMVSGIKRLRSSRDEGLRDASIGPADTRLSNAAPLGVLRTPNIRQAGLVEGETSCLQVSACAGVVCCSV